jgi:hypothetical protein
VLALTWRLLLKGKKGERERDQFVESAGNGVGNGAVNAGGERSGEQKDVPTAQTARRGEVVEGEDQFRGGRRFRLCHLR